MTNESVNWVCETCGSEYDYNFIRNLKMFTCKNCRTTQCVPCNPILSQSKNTKKLKERFGAT